ncbi:hypothetical protein ACJ72_03330 [Emergomyces africanus]|uniref:Protein-S-isoprenylcysteine O-methyltransferase n=1 Tax=Emergomyces africanus TaxID=1955775 RepID=A0A1B7NZY0_9EURO|nr:hypothetical protein ACJ72_03330 [Emergomyces africanus]
MEHEMDASTSSLSSNNHEDGPPLVAGPPSAGADWRPRREYAPYRPERRDNGATTKPPREIVDPAILPGGKKSLAGVSIRSFVLGQVFGLCIGLTFLLLKLSNPLWRVPFFLTTLSLFHFLEYYITARYSTPYASISAFLLSSNGAAYNLAHTSALAECLLGRLVLPEGYVKWISLAFGDVKVQIGLGLIFTAVGQVVRSLAMVQAGTNFTHTVQSRQREGHTLVKDGIYSILRHPSYFGFFWWGLGTQLVLGNAVCFVAYALVLWKFFSSRIQREEKFLISFFDKEYIEYRESTREHRHHLSSQEPGKDTKQVIIYGSQPEIPDLPTPPPPTQIKYQIATHLIRQYAKSALMSTFQVAASLTKLCAVTARRRPKTMTMIMTMTILIPPTSLVAATATVNK